MKTSWDLRTVGGLGLALVLVMLGIVVGLHIDGAPVAANPAPRVEPPSPLRAVEEPGPAELAVAAYERHIAALNRLDAAAYFAAYADEVDCFYNRPFTSKAWIESRRARLFTRQRVSRYRPDVEVLAFASNEVTLRDRGVFGRHDHDKVVVMHRRGDAWRIHVEVGAHAHRCYPRYHRSARDSRPRLAGRTSRSAPPPAVHVAATQPARAPAAVEPDCLLAAHLDHHAVDRCGRFSLTRTAGVSAAPIRRDGRTAVAIRYSRSRLGPGFGFDGIDASGGSALSVNTTPTLTIETWIHPLEVDPSGPTAGPKPTVVRQVDGQYRLWVYDGRLALSLGRPCGPFRGYRLALDSDRLPLRRWVHVVGIVDHRAGRVELYRDGRLVAEARSGSCGEEYAPARSSGAVRIGNSGGNDIFAGYIESVRIRSGAHRPAGEASWSPTARHQGVSGSLSGRDTDPDRGSLARESVDMARRFHRGFTRTDGRFEDRAIEGLIDVATPEADEPTRRIQRAGARMILGNGTGDELRDAVEGSFRR